MANDTESEGCVVISAVRSGLKRELAFSLKAQSEICGGALGRTRSRKVQIDSPSSHVNSSSRNKRSKKSCDALREDKCDAGKLDFGSGGAAQAGNVANADLKDGARDKPVMLVKGAEDLIGEEEAKSDVVDLEDEPERVFEDSQSEKDADEIKTGHSCQKQHKAVTTIPGGNKATEKESDVEKKQGSVCNNESFLVDKPSRRFTRSMLKPKMEEKENAEPKRKAKSIVSNPEQNGDEDKLGIVVSASGIIPAKFEMKMSKKVGLRCPFVTLDDFLETGLLEGLLVKHCVGLTEQAGLGGVLKGRGILCFCDQCKGVQVVSPTIFELHAGSSSNVASEHIFLENGRSISEVMNAVNDSPLETLKEAVQDVLGASSINRCTICMNCRAPLKEVEGGGTDLLCKICLELKEAWHSPCQTVDATDLLKEVPDTTDQTKVLDAFDLSENLREVQETAEGSPGQCLVKKSSVSATKSSTSQIKSRGRLTRKDLGLHKLVFEEDVLPDGTEVGYFIQGKKMLVGYKKGYGIFCSCCESEISASQFEAHAGFSSRRKPLC